MEDTAVVTEDPEACQEVTEVDQDKHLHLGDMTEATAVDSATMADLAVHPVAVPEMAVSVATTAAPGAAIKSKNSTHGIKEAAKATSVVMVAAEAGAVLPETTTPVVAAAGATILAGTIATAVALEATVAALAAAATMVTKAVTALDLAGVKDHPWVVALEAVRCVPIMAAATDLRLIR